MATDPAPNAPHEDVINATSADHVREATNALTRIKNLGRRPTRDPAEHLKESKRRTILPAFRNYVEAGLNFVNQTLLGGHPSVQVTLVETAAEGLGRGARD